ncbi:hypothetical protein ASPCAL10263 [Aspergillus calidoustus]|uniref:BZIP domain-containing protein n=1 Tax=Aspergillus calidoustus TaxID=454130 RepID=A0A0U5G639_ASPCI|nr:hypothetical protein ASPCAL10263 [Aspergillus calidoustus]
MDTSRSTRQSIKAKAGQPSSSLRIRDNQRRSRARRKEYIRDLEQRLRTFEASGVRATQEVQAAGRMVAVENTLLRSLLRLHGVPDQDIQQYLTAHRKDLPPILQSRAGLKSRPHVVEFSSPSATAESSTQSISSNHERGDRTLGMVASGKTSSQFDSQVAVKEQLVPIHSLIHTIPELPPLCANQSSGQSTPCETAARIIESMRSYSDTRDVRWELGCQSSSDCMVRNMDIFQLLE